VTELDDDRVPPDVGMVAESLQAGVERMLRDTPYAGPVRAGQAGGQSMTDAIRWLRAAAHSLASEIQPIIDGLTPPGSALAARDLVVPPGHIAGAVVKGRVITSTGRGVRPAAEDAMRRANAARQRGGMLDCGQVFAIAFFLLVVMKWPGLLDIPERISFVVSVISAIIATSKR
jgi:hypothetical protein